MKDAYNGLLDVMSGTAANVQRPTVFTGIVRSAAPLTIETAGVLLSGSDLLVNAELLTQTGSRSITAIKGMIKGQCTGCGQGSTAEFTAVEGAAAATVTRGGMLTAGCRVALITADRDKFIVLCKVVSM